MQLNERIESKPIDIIKEGLPKGVLARVTYPIMIFGKINENRRIYERAVAEKVLTDKDIQSKLKERNLFGDLEHPQDFTDIRLDPHKTSHVITKLWIDESRSALMGSFELLNTLGGKFIHCLLEAGCLVGTSSRAEGECENCLDEEKNKYSRVIPEKYRLACVDFTGNRSTPDALPENYVSVVKAQYEAKTLDMDSAVALLENVQLDSAKLLCEGICRAAEHKCDHAICQGKGCDHGKNESLNEDRRADYVNFITKTLIPDLKNSSHDETAKDFETLVAFVNGAKKVGDWDREDFVDYLEGTLMPDLRASGQKETANDFRTGCFLLALDKKYSDVVHESVNEDSKNNTAGLLGAAHKPENCLLVWWYNLVTHEFKKDNNPMGNHTNIKGEHVLQNIVTDKTQMQWVKGRVFKYAEITYLLIYWPHRRNLTPDTLLDILDKCQNSVNSTITGFIDDEGKDISSLFESLGYCEHIEKSSLGGWTIDKNGKVIECKINESGFYRCLSCNRTYESKDEKCPHCGSKKRKYIGSGTTYVDRSSNESIKPGDIVTVNGVNGIINQVFSKTGKCIVQEGITRKVVTLAECIKVAIKEDREYPENSCANCNKELEDTSTNSYKCKSCGFNYSHASNRTAKEQAEDYKAYEAKKVNEETATLEKPQYEFIITYPDKGCMHTKFFDNKEEAETFANANNIPLDDIKAEKMRESKCQCGADDVNDKGICNNCKSRVSGKPFDNDQLAKDMANGNDDIEESLLAKYELTEDKTMGKGNVEFESDKQALLDLVNVDAMGKDGKDLFLHNLEHATPHAVKTAVRIATVEMGDKKELAPLGIARINDILSEAIIEEGKTPDEAFSAFYAKLQKLGDDFGSFELDRELKKFDKVFDKLSTSNQKKYNRIDAQFNGAFGNESKLDEVKNTRTMYGKKVTKVTKGGKIDHYEVDGKTFKTIAELEDYIPELKETRESPGPEKCRHCKTHIGSKVADNFDGLCPDCYDSKKNEAVEYGRPVAARIDKKGKQYAKLVMKAINGGDEDFDSAKAEAVKLGIKADVFDADVQDLDAELVNLGESKVNEMALSGKTYTITAQAFDRKTNKPVGKSRDEVVDISSNKLFKGCKNIGDIESAYESFWNDLNPNSSEVVKVSSIKAGGTVDEAKEKTWFVTVYPGGFAPARWKIKAETKKEALDRITVTAEELKESKVNEDADDDQDEGEEVEGISYEQVVESVPELAEKDRAQVEKGIKDEYEEHSAIIKDDASILGSLVLAHLTKCAEYYDVVDAALELYKEKSDKTLDAKVDHEASETPAEEQEEEMTEALKLDMKTRIKESINKETQEEVLEQYKNAFDKIEENYISDVLNLTERLNSVTDKSEALKEAEAKVKSLEKELEDVAKQNKKWQEENDEFNKQLGTKDNEITAKELELKTVKEASEKELKESRVRIIAKMTGLDLDESTVATLKECKDDKQLMVKLEEYRSKLARTILHNNIIKENKVEIRENKPAGKQSEFSKNFERLIS